MYQGQHFLAFLDARVHISYLRIYIDAPTLLIWVTIQASNKCCMYVLEILFTSQRVDSHILISYFSLQFDMTRITVRYNQFFTQLGVSQHNSFSCMKSFCYSIRWQPVPNHRSFLNTHYPTHYCVAELMFRSSVTRIASCSTLSNGVKINR